MRISELEQVPLKHHDKKILSEILRVGSGMAVPANKSEHRSPITFAKLIKRLARFLLFPLRAGTGKNYAPPRRGESVRSVTHVRYRAGVHKHGASYLRNYWAS